VELCSRQEADVGALIAQLQARLTTLQEQRAAIGAAYNGAVARLEGAYRSGMAKERALLDAQRRAKLDAWRSAPF